MSEKKKEALRGLKFVLFSMSAGLIQISTFALMYNLLHWNWWVSYLISLVLSVLWNFTFNRKYTFKSANNVPKAMLLVFAYYCVFTPLSLLLGNYLEKSLGWNGNLVTVINMVLNFVTEFLYDRFVVFRDSIDTNDLAMKEKELEEARNG